MHSARHWSLWCRVCSQPPCAGALTSANGSSIKTGYPSTSRLLIFCFGVVNCIQTLSTHWYTSTKVLIARKSFQSFLFNKIFVTESQKDSDFTSLWPKYVIKIHDICASRCVLWPAGARLLSSDPYNNQNLHLWSFFLNIGIVVVFWLQKSYEVVADSKGAACNVVYKNYWGLNLQCKQEYCYVW